MVEPQQLDVDSWKLSSRGALAIESRRVATAITIAFFAFVFLWSGVEPALTLLLTLIYASAMRYRWANIGTKYVWIIPFAAAFAAYQLSGGATSFRSSYAVAQFVALMPALYACIAPSGIGLPWQDLNSSKRIGRGEFIAWAFPFFVLAAAPYWADLDRVLSSAWNLVGAPTEHVGPSATFWYLCLALMGPAAARVNDAGWKGWVFSGLAALVLARAAAQFNLVPQRYTSLPDLCIAAVCLVLCLWPSRPSDA